MQTEPKLTELASNGHSAGAARSRQPAADAARSGIAQEFQNFVADMEDLVEASTSLTGDALASAKAKLYSRIAAARIFVEEIPATISARARNTVKEADGYVREQPWQVVGMTAAVGMLIGFLLGRRGR
jgi:ElaB/YqjD/DUF883 family membrane-anchored ribosome-binding protein